MSARDGTHRASCIVPTGWHGPDAQAMSRQLATSNGRRSGAISDGVSTAMLAVAAFATAWCAYQASLWSGMQVVEMAYSEHTARAASETQITGNQEFQYDSTMFYAYLDAKTSSRDRFAAYIYERFRPVLKTAVDSWLSEPRDSPRGPLMMPEYKIDDWAKADALREEARGHATAVLRANNVADNYIFGTVLFAAVSLMGGAVPRLGIRPLRRQGLTALTVLAVAGSLVWVLALPVGHRQSAAQLSARDVSAEAAEVGRSWKLCCQKDRTS